jgi:hypothetical protein
MSTTFELALEATDVSGQKTFSVPRVPMDSTVGELVRGLVPSMRLPETDVAGRPLNYHALLEREGRHLHASEAVADVLEEGDRVVLQPNIEAGGGVDVITG